MSSIASFIKLPISAIPGLREAAVPKKRLFGGLKDTYHDYLEEHGSEVASYHWSGSVIATLLPYLEKYRGVDLMPHDEDRLSEFLSGARHSSIFVLRSSVKKYLSKMNAEAFTSDELRDYFNQFNACNVSEIGEAMLDGIRALEEAITKVDDTSVVLLSIG